MIAWDVECVGGEHVENSGSPLTVYTYVLLFSRTVSP